jgi:hypothetical protein
VGRKVDIDEVGIGITHHSGHGKISPPERARRERRTIRLLATNPRGGGVNAIGAQCLNEIGAIGIEPANSYV